MTSRTITARTIEVRTTGARTTATRTIEARTAGARTTATHTLPVQQKNILCLLASLLIACMACTYILTSTPEQAHALPVRQTDISTAPAGSYLLGLDGTFSSPAKETILKRINEIRKEACTKGVPDPSNPRQKLTAADYTPMKWSSGLEIIAQTRAAEGSINQDHGRPNGDRCFSAYQDSDISSMAENLAWNYSGMMDGIEQWYEEKADWVAQNSNAVTGHYTSIIDPTHTHIGLGTFSPAQGGWTCTAGEFLNGSYYSATIDEAKVGVTGKYRQLIEIPATKVSGLAVSGKATLAGIASCVYSAQVKVKLENVFGSPNNVHMAPLETLTWTSSKPAVATVAASGKVTSAHCGKTTIKATCMGLSGSKVLTVNPKGTTLKKLTSKKGALTVSWKKQSSLTQGYEIRYSLKKSMAKAKTIKVKGAKKASKVIKKLQSKKRYYVQVRTYAKADGALYYSSWSAKKSQKTK